MIARRPHRLASRKLLSRYCLMESYSFAESVLKMASRSSDVSKNNIPLASKCSLIVGQPLQQNHQKNAYTLSFAGPQNACRHEILTGCRTAPVNTSSKVSARTDAERKDGPFLSMRLGQAEQSYYGQQCLALCIK